MPFLLFPHLSNGADLDLAIEGKSLRTAELIDTELERLLLKYGAKFFTDSHCKPA